MEDTEQDSYMPEAGLSSPRSATTAPSQPPPDSHTDPKDPVPLASENRSTPPPPQPEASTTAPSPRSPSHSPTSSRRGTKRSPSVSPVPEELPPRTTSTDEPKQGDPSPPSKRPRPASDPTTKRRGQSLFGVLASTLSQFKAESESTRSTTAAQRRAEIEARLATKLKQTDSILSATERKKALVWEARTIAEEIATGDAQRKTLRGMKRRMASFLFTPIASAHRRARRGGEGARLAPEIPTSTSAREERRGEVEVYPLYFLPGKTLPEQEDKLNQQEDDVDEKIDRFDDAWDDRRSELMARLDGVKERISKLSFL